MYNNMEHRDRIKTELLANLHRFKRCGVRRAPYHPNPKPLTLEGLIDDAFPVAGLAAMVLAVMLFVAVVLDQVLRHVLH